MSCRRSRIIIKPNIRPSVARSGPAAAKAKPAAASSAGAPTSATAANSGGSESGHVKATTTPAADKDTDETANTVVSGSEAVTVEVKAVPTSKNDVGSIPDTSAEKDGMGNHGESIVSDSGVGSSLSQSEQTEESSLGVEPRGGFAVSESGDGVSDVGPSLQLSEKPLEEPGREDIGAQPAQTAGLSTPVAELPSVSSPVTPQDAPFVPPLMTSSLSKDGKVVVSVEGDMSVAMEEEVAPSEADTSCMSEAVSLEPTEERRGELEEDVEVKKPRRRRMRKPCTELLQSREKSPDRQKMKMSDLLSWNPQQNFFPKKKKKPSVKNETSSTAAHVTISVDDDAESSNQSASLPAPQVMIGPDGNIILNTESLLIHTEKVETGSPKEVIEEDDDDRYLNTNSYRTTKNAKLWTEKETEKFFLGLSMCGTDFSLLTRLMPHRSRRDLKNKFRREERRNRPLIDSALANRQKYDPAPFERLLETVNSKVKQEAKKAVKKEKEPRKAQKRKKPKSKSLFCHLPVDSFVNFKKR
ncbi:transcription factor TFIIIB component B'' homolog [Aplysia californica]|uniref:Transcription factor TFIIIB component B'' homolog n=1 Tax=Aplysia californica TaxID=6500 RepID=A0ABM0JYC8_APLCA|nr:transcription factor TFIIIB component B'' homolog [Aplysia californica]